MCKIATFTVSYNELCWFNYLCDGFCGFHYTKILTTNDFQTTILPNPTVLFIEFIFYQLCGVFSKSA